MCISYEWETAEKHDKVTLARICWSKWKFGLKNLGLLGSETHVHYFCTYVSFLGVLHGRKAKACLPFCSRECFILNKNWKSCFVSHGNSVLLCAGICAISLFWWRDSWGKNARYSRGIRKHFTVWPQCKWAISTYLLPGWNYFIPINRLLGSVMMFLTQISFPLCSAARTHWSCPP